MVSMDITYCVRQARTLRARTAMRHDNFAVPVFVGFADQYPLRFSLLIDDGRKFS